MVQVGCLLLLVTFKTNPEMLLGHITFQFPKAFETNRPISPNLKVKFELATDGDTDEYV